MSLNQSIFGPEELEAAVLAVLSEVVDAASDIDVVSGGQVYAVVATGGAVRVLLDPERFPDDGSQHSLAETLTPLVEGVAGVGRVVVKPRPRPVASLPGLPGVGRVVGVHSGKGGVGKSTVTVNLALALVARGFKVGLLDADVYGPSAPTLLGITGRLESAPGGSKVRPLEAHGLKVVSLGFLLPSNQALIWRGSLVEEGLAQLLSDVAWGELDLLLVDLPPGTSDVHLALARHVCLSGIVTVTAPGQVSLDDVRRGMEMFADMAVPSLGIVENMSGMVCRRCGSESPLFGSGGGVELAQQTGLPLLGRLAFYPALAEASDRGEPAVVDAPGSLQAAQFHSLAARLARDLMLEPGVSS